MLLVLALLTGWGRVYSGLHFPFDIFGSVAVAAISAFLVVAFQPLLVPLNRKLVDLQNALRLRIKKCRDSHLSRCERLGTGDGDRLAPGQEIKGPMAIVILGGLLTSMVLNLLVLPPWHSAMDGSSRGGMSSPTGE
ncbi:MAG: phosphatase PAP2 family protein [Desulfobacteraceae bacterium]|nr:phosphatase PAP2 family protein [Desulfobacteraceae bacterium]